MKRPTVEDYFSLALTFLARLRRRQLHSSQEQSCRLFYEEFFNEKDVSAGLLDARKRMRQEVLKETLLRYLPQGALLVDIGCGVGESLYALREYYRMIGLDYAFSSGLLGARQLLGSEAALCQGSVNELPFASSSLDGSLCLEVLEHLPDDSLALKELARVLKPGGLLIAAVPYSYYFSAYRRLIGHFRHYSVKVWTIFFVKAALKCWNICLIIRTGTKPMREVIAL